MAFRAGQFKSVKTPHIRRNKFDLSHEKRMTADMFYLYPILNDLCIPGDIWQIGNEIICRLNPLVAPIMHEINIYVHYFFVPLRLLWDQWEEFITGGKDGDFVADIPKHETGDIRPGTLWDYLGFNTISDNDRTKLVVKPSAFSRRAYNFIWNEFYREQNLRDPIDLDYDNNFGTDRGLMVRCWEKDYFTSMLPWQQRGQAPALPISIGGLNINWDKLSTNFYNQSDPPPPNTIPLGALGTNTNAPYIYTYGGTSPQASNAITNVRNAFKGIDISIDPEGTTTFDVSDLRLAFQIQKFLERNARTGARYVEFLKAHFPAYPRDDRLQRPEYIGGSKTPIIISEVLQTSQTTAQSPQGNLAGHGISADRTFCGSYRVQEHGIIMGIMSIMPRTMYQQGIDRIWLQESRYDFYFPEFANLSEQAVMQPEIYNQTPASKDKVIGYQGRWDEYRYKRNSVHGLFKDDPYFSAWALARKFSTPPTLNLDLVRPNSEERLALKRFLAVPTEPAFIISIGNKCHVTRPMPYIAEPGLIDHG